jgi:hypothetical protein
MKRFNLHEMHVKLHKRFELPVVLYGCETWSLTIEKNIDLGLSRRWRRGKYWDINGGSKRRLEKTTVKMCA